MTESSTTFAVDDRVNARILAVSEDRVEGFWRDPLGRIAELAELDVDTVIERIRSMMAAGTIRRVRQTLLSTSLAPGALVAWRVPAPKLNDAFETMFERDPFSGHVVIRSTDDRNPGAAYRLWTTLKVPVGFSITKHCDYLASRVDADHYKLLPAKKLFALGVGHVRRRNLPVGSRSDEPARAIDVSVTHLTETEWRVLMVLKREFTPPQIRRDIWVERAAESGEPLESFYQVAEDLAARKIVGRFSTFLEHVKKLKDGTTVTKYNALFHWSVPPGREVEAGLEVGRHHIMTHAYWREAGPDFGSVNVMGVAHGTDKRRLLEHKAAIDRHLVDAGIQVGYTSVFWGGRSEIKPSEISPIAYRQWCHELGLDPEQMSD